MPGTVLDSGNREVIGQTMTENLHSGEERTLLINKRTISNRDKCHEEQNSRGLGSDGVGSDWLS